ncbi:dTMP kinase [Oxyplasma meridianum]|uniref:Probable thymidylate kinase n=1 Tax=Oxyplasma meridianum TaxID=3073602 RepID=A0AAX4NJE4_9ARCH
MFVSIEGIDGSGKSTLSRNLKRKLLELGRSVFLTHEPTDGFFITESEQKNRTAENAIELFFRFTTDRMHHQKIINGELDRERIVISDRYIHSSYAYQGPLMEMVFGGMDGTLEWMMSVSRIIKRMPDLIIFLDLEPGRTTSRIAARKGRSGFEDPDYLKLVRTYYQKMIGSNWLVIDSTLPVEKVTAAALEAVLARLP